MQFSLKRPFALFLILALTCAAIGSEAYCALFLERVSASDKLVDLPPDLELLRQRARQEFLKNLHAQLDRIPAEKIPQILEALDASIADDKRLDAMTVYRTDSFGLPRPVYKIGGAFFPVENRIVYRGEFGAQLYGLPFFAHEIDHLIRENLSPVKNPSLRRWIRDYLLPRSDVRARETPAYGQTYDLTRSILALAKDPRDFVRIISYELQLPKKLRANFEKMIALIYKPTDDGGLIYDPNAFNYSALKSEMSPAQVDSLIGFVNHHLYVDQFINAVLQVSGETRESFVDQTLLRPAYRAQSTIERKKKATTVVTLAVLVGIGLFIRHTLNDGSPGDSYPTSTSISAYEYEQIPGLWDEANYLEHGYKMHRDLKLENKCSESTEAISSEKHAKFEVPSDLRSGTKLSLLFQADDRSRATSHISLVILDPSGNFVFRSTDETHGLGGRYTLLIPKSALGGQYQLRLCFASPTQSSQYYSTNFRVN